MLVAAGLLIALLGGTAAAADAPGTTDRERVASFCALVTGRAAVPAEPPCAAPAPEPGPGNGNGGNSAGNANGRP